MPGDNDYVSRGKAAVSTDGDSSAELGLDHSYAKGRPVVTLPEQRPEPDPAMVGLSPDAIVEYLDQQEDDRDANNIEKLMKEVPGGKTPGSHSSSGSISKPKPRATGQSQRNDPLEGVADLRPHTMAGKVSDRAKYGLDSQTENVGQMLNTLGETLATGVSWARVEFELRGLMNRKAS